jgi:transcriptional regulator GlxA family with amidase domain
MATANKNTGNLKGESREEYCAHEFTTRVGCDPRVLEVIDFMKANLHRKLTSKDLAEAADLSVSHLFRLFKAETRLTPKQYLIELRMARAGELITKSRLSMKEIMGQVGYDTYKNFLNRFKKSFRVSPSQYRKSVLAKRARRLGSSEE